MRKPWSEQMILECELGLFCRPTEDGELLAQGKVFGQQLKAGRPGCVAGRPKTTGGDCLVRLSAKVVTILRDAS